MLFIILLILLVVNKTKGAQVFIFADQPYFDSSLFFNSVRALLLFSDFNSGVYEMSVNRGVPIVTLMKGSHDRVDTIDALALGNYYLRRLNASLLLKAPISLLNRICSSTNGSSVFDEMKVKRIFLAIHSNDFNRALCNYLSMNSTEVDVNDACDFVSVQSFPNSCVASFARSTVLNFHDAVPTPTILRSLARDMGLSLSDRTLDIVAQSVETLRSPLVARVRNCNTLASVDQSPTDTECDALLDRVQVATDAEVCHKNLQTRAVDIARRVSPESSREKPLVSRELFLSLLSPAHNSSVKSMTPFPSSEYASNVEEILQQRFRADQFAFLAISVHPTAAFDMQTGPLMWLNQSASVRVLAGRCSLVRLCARDLPSIITRSSMLEHFDRPCPHIYQREFYEALRNFSLLYDVDAIIQSHLVANSVLYLPLGRPLLVYVSTRFESRRSGDALRRWLRELKLIASRADNVIAANSLYDAHYVQYFTGIMPIYLPSWTAGYLPNDTVWSAAGTETDEAAASQKKIVLVAPRERFNKVAYAEMRAVVGNFTQSGLPVHTYSEAFGEKRYSYEQVIERTLVAIVLPYQVSTMSIFEFYRIGIPMLVPSARFLTQLHLKYQMLKERTWALTFDHVLNGSEIEPHALALDHYDPGDDTSFDAVHHWVQYADFYQFPHIVTFDSWLDLPRKLERTIAEATAIHQRMMEWNAVVREDLRRRWLLVLDQMFGYGRRPRMFQHALLPSFEKSFHIWYNFTVPSSYTACSAVASGT